jgi:hypothetical protein
MAVELQTWNLIYAEELYAYLHRRWRLRLWQLVGYAPQPADLLDRAERALSDKAPDTRARYQSEAWRRAVGRLRARGEPLAPEVLDAVWNKGQEFAAAAGALGAAETASLIRELVDLDVGPASFIGARSDARQGAQWPSQVERQSRVPGLEVSQKVFLEGPHQLDDFARDVAEGSGDEAVALLSGVRGSGKSTALNRVEWYCNNWLAGHHRPLLIRFDLGTAFKSQQFVVDLAAEVCREVQEHCKRPPLGCPFFFHRIRFFFGQIGRWCASNLRWSAVVGILAVIFLMIDLLRAEATASLESISTVLRSAGAGVAILVLIAMAVVVVGMFHHLAHWSSRRRPDPDAVPRQSYFKIFALLAIVPLGIMLALRYMPWTVMRPGGSIVIDDRLKTAAMRLGATTAPAEPGNDNVSRLVAAVAAGHDEVDFAKKPTTAPATESRFLAAVDPADARKRVPEDLVTVRQAAKNADAKQIDPLAVLALGGVSIVCIGLAQFLLPKWWWTYGRCQSLADAIRGRDGQSAPTDLPFGSHVTALARILLPQPAGLPDLRSMDSPFQHQQIKELLRRCAADFGRVVILIDDVDVLPSSEFHELFRLLRPMSKVTGVRCVVCVPLYFYYAIKAESLGDIHSTAQRCLVMGDPDLYSGPAEKFSLRQGLTAHEFAKKLRAVLATRLRLKVSGGAHAAKGAAVIDHLTERWGAAPADWARVKAYLNRVGASRRELIRETARLVDNPRGRPFDDKHRSTVSGWGNAFERRKTEYHRNEQSLVADVVARVAHVKATLEAQQLTRRANHPDTPPAPVPAPPACALSTCALSRLLPPQPDPEEPEKGESLG